MTAHADKLRQRFDRLLEEVIADLPDDVRALIDRIPVVVLDRPTPDLLNQLAQDGLLEPGDDGADLCGLHTGIGLTDRTVDDPEGWGALDGSGAPEQVHLFRDGIVTLAGGWDKPDADDALYEEIRITLLHELGHHHGLDEDDLDELGFA